MAASRPHPHPKHTHKNIHQTGGLHTTAVTPITHTQTQTHTHNTRMRAQSAPRQRNRKKKKTPTLCSPQRPEGGHPLGPTGSDNRRHRKPRSTAKREEVPQRITEAWWQRCIHPAAGEHTRIGAQLTCWPWPSWATWQSPLPSWQSPSWVLSQQLPSWWAPWPWLPLPSSAWQPPRAPPPS